jgi:hypothetical protein
LIHLIHLINLIHLVIFPTFLSYLDPGFGSTPHEFSAIQVKF